MTFTFLIVLSEMTETIPKPLLSLERMIVKDTELLKAEKGREAERTASTERFLQKEHETRKFRLLSGMILWLL